MSVTPMETAAVLSLFREKTLLAMKQSAKVEGLAKTAGMSSEQMCDKLFADRVYRSGIVLRHEIKHSGRRPVEAAACEFQAA